MPFGLRKTAQSFQQLIDEVLRGVPFTFAYMDDVLIASKMNRNIITTYTKSSKDDFKDAFAVVYFEF